MNYFCSVVSEKKIVHELAKMHKITNYSIKIRGGTPILQTWKGFIQFVQIVNIGHSNLI